MGSSYIIFSVCVFVFVSYWYAIPVLAVDRTEALGVLLRLHRQFCPTVSLCTYNASTDSVVSNLTVDESCCYPCRCDDSCFLTKQCCPDLPASFNNRSLEPLPGNKSMKGEGSDSEDETNVEMGPETVDIHFARIIEGSVCVEQAEVQKYKTWHHGRAYWMVWSCPEQLKNSKPYKLCLNFEKLGGGEVTSYLPVTSNLSNITYRNRYCLECNEGSNVEYFRWKPTLICLTGFPNDIPAMQTFTDIIDYTRSFESNYRCNLLYIPPEHISILLVECIHASISSCNVTGNWIEYDPIIDQACTSFFNPVDGSFINYNYNTLTTLRNIACFVCNADEYDEFLTPCSRPMHYSEVDHHTVEIFDGEDSLYTSYTSIPEADPEDSLIIDGSTGCKKGYFKDRYQDSCRKIQCPRDHMLYKQACMSIFWTLHGMKIRLQVEVTLYKNFFFENFNGIANALEKAFEMYIEDRDFVLFEYSIWAKTKTENTVDYLYYNALLETNVTFNLVLNRLRDIGKGKQIFGRLFDLNNESVEYSVAFTNDVKLVGWQPLQMEDMVDDKKLTMLVHSADQVEYSVSIPVTTTSYCLRVKLKQKEFKLSMGKLQITQSKFDIETRSFDLASDNMAYVCIDEYNKGKADTAGPRTEATAIDTMTETQESSLAFLFGCAAMTGGVIVLFIVVSTFRKIYQARLQSDSPRETTVVPELFPGTYI